MGKGNWKLGKFMLTNIIARDFTFMSKCAKTWGLRPDPTGDKELPALLATVGATVVAREWPSPHTP